MKVGVVGTGYVGLVSGACFAELGNDVVCVDIDAAKVAYLQKGESPIHEPGLQDLLTRNIREKRLTFTTELHQVLDATVVFLALPTPPNEDGSADLSYVLGVADQIGKNLKDYLGVINKSTVPVGTVEKVRAAIAASTSVEFDVVSNPEFLREGQAVGDFLNPDRVVIGSSSAKATKVLRELYRPLVRRQPERLIITDAVTAELSKYAANGFLANKISFINALTGVCEASGANIDDVRKVMGMDSRIGNQFLYAGPGYGGSCFPKDTRALVEIGNDYGVDLPIMKAVISTNDYQKTVLARKVTKYFKNNVKGKKFAQWGLAFKDNTDDIRESPALDIIEDLTKKGADIIAFDPQAVANVQQLIGQNKHLSFADNEYDAVKGADALIIVTNCKEFFAPDYDRLKRLLKTPAIFDGRNLYDLEDMAKYGFHYESIGRPVV